MNRIVEAVSILSILCIPVAVSLQCASAAELLTPEGNVVRGEARASSGDLTVAGTTVPVEGIVALRFGDNAGSDSIDRGLVLVSGDVLAGRARMLRSGRIEFVSDTLGSISVPASDAEALVFVPRSLARLTDPQRRLSRQVGPRGGRGPVRGVFLTNGDTVPGKVSWINSQAIGVLTGRRIVKVPREHAAMVYLRMSAGRPNAGGSPAERVPPAPPKPRQYVRLVNGDRLSGSLVGLTAEHLELRTEFAGTVRVRSSEVGELWSEGGRLVPVSTLTPSEVRQIPQFDEVFPHRLDRNPSGGFLSIGGRRYERGLGCHSRCELVYELGGAYSTFLAEIGVEDQARGRGEVGLPSGGAARARGEVVFRCLADGKVVFESGVCRGGEPPRLVRAGVAGARKLRLVVDFGPGGVSLGDRAAWGRAVLVRRTAKSDRR
ncbi:MAG: NPCBM/NEW2 domain-containing protein [Planctomycetota bacterium]|jgi:hypothetical protein